MTRRSTPNSKRSKKGRRGQRPQSKSRSTRSSRAVRRGALSARATRQKQSYRHRKSLPRLFRGGVTPDSDSGDRDADEDSMSDTFYGLDPVNTHPPNEEELERCASEELKKKNVEDEVQRLKDEEWLRTYRVQEKEKAKKRDAALQKKALFDKGEKARVPLFNNKCPRDTRARLFDLFVVSRAWGYGAMAGHGAYEAATHGDFTAYQPVTDPLMRGLLNVENTGTVFMDDITGLTTRLSSSLSYFEREGADTQRYLSEILRPYMETQGIRTKLMELTELGRSEAGDGGNQCLWYLGACASNILSFADGDYGSIGENNEEIGKRFGFTPVPESNKRQKRK